MKAFLQSANANVSPFELLLLNCNLRDKPNIRRTVRGSRTRLSTSTAALSANELYTLPLGSTNGGLSSFITAPLRVGNRTEVKKRPRGLTIYVTLSCKQCKSFASMQPEPILPMIAVIHCGIVGFVLFCFFKKEIAQNADYKNVPACWTRGVAILLDAARRCFQSCERRNNVAKQRWQQRSA